MKLDVEEQPAWRYWGDEKEDGAIYSIYLKKVRYHRPCKSVNSDSEDEISHLEWETVRVRFIKAGTLEKLTRSLTCENGELDSSYVNIFFATYRAFAAAEEVLELIIHRYSNVDEEFASCHDAEKEAIRKALRQSLFIWLDTYPEDLLSSNSLLYEKLKDFCDKRTEDEDFRKSVKEKVHNFFKEEDLECCVRLTEAPGNKVQCLSPLHYQDCCPRDFLDIPNQHFAEQLTRIDAELFRKVVPYQCLGGIWSRRDRNGTMQTASVANTVEQFNAVLFRVISSVVVDLNLKPPQRAKIVSKWIDIAQELRVLKNFSSLKAIISGLQSTSVHRLGSVWMTLPKDKLELFQELARIFSEENNQLFQRQLLQKEGTAKFPEAAGENDRQLSKIIQQRQGNNHISYGTVPYLGTFLTDLIMIDSAIPDVTEGGLLNFEKRRKEFDILAQIKLLQSSAGLYNIDCDRGFLEWFNRCLILEENACFELSCLIEPQERTPGGTSREPKMKKRIGLGHKKTDSLASTASSSSGSQFYLDSADINSTIDLCLFERKLSTSSSDSPQPSNEHSLNTSSPASSLVSSPSKSNDPYRTPDFYIIRVSVESPNNEIQGVNLYKSIILRNNERTPTVIRNALYKHDIEGDPDEYTLSQIIHPKELVLPPDANVYYAINIAYDLNFILRRKLEISAKSDRL